MSFYLAVWAGQKPVSNREAAKYYDSLQSGNVVSPFDESVYAFSCALTNRFPDLDMIAEDDVDSSPWASGLELAGGHMIMVLRPERYAEAFPLILQLAEQHGLVCFDPQNIKVHLPSCLKS
jgi:hypothetical protein